MRIVPLILVGLTGHAFAGPTQSSFTPTGYKYPITRISLFKADSTGEQVLYQCSGTTSADCLVDVTSPVSIAAIEESAAKLLIEPGTYAYVRLQSCPAGTTGQDTMNVEVMGSVSLSTQTFNTSSTSAGGMAADGSPEFTSVSLGCGGAVVQLIEPLIVTAGSEQTLTLLIDLTHVTWTDANASSGMGGCKSDNGAGQDICTTMPFIIPYVGAGEPTFERYLVSHLAGAGTPELADANGAVNVAVDAASRVFYVGVSPYLSETSASPGDGIKGGPDYNTTTRMLSVNTDGTLSFQTGGDITDDRVGFTAFQRSTHTGTCKDEGLSSPIWNYKAYRQ